MVTGWGEKQFQAQTRGKQQKAQNLVSFLNNQEAITTYDSLGKSLIAGFFLVTVVARANFYGIQIVTPSLKDVNCLIGVFDQVKNTTKLHLLRCKAISKEQNLDKFLHFSNFSG